EAAVERGNAGLAGGVKFAVCIRLNVSRSHAVIYRRVGWLCQARVARIGQLKFRSKPPTDLSADWQQKYGHPIYLVESFVHEPRFEFSWGSFLGVASWFSWG